MVKIYEMSYKNWKWHINNIEKMKHEIYNWEVTHDIWWDEDMKNEINKIDYTYLLIKVIQMKI